MKKKILALVMVIVLAATAVVGGSMAYLQDDDSDVNVMTLGNVQIEQIEQERDANGNLVDFTQAKPLYPAVFEGSSIPWADESDWVVANDQAWKVVADNANVIDKFVTVENTGKSDAYVRTIIAYEGDETYGPEGAYIHVVHNGTNVDPAIAITCIGTVEINGVDYTVYEYVYPEALAAGETSIASLKQVYMNKDADNDVVANYGDTYEILVLSQAVQTQGFANAADALDTAFGDANAANVKAWFEGMGTPEVLVSGVDVNKSTPNGGTFVLGADIQTSDYGDDARYGWGYEYIVRNGADFTLDLNGKTITHDTVNENANKNAFTYTFVANNAGTKLTINGDGKIYANNSKGYTCAIQGKEGTLITLNGGDYQVDNGIAVWAGAGSHIVINGGSFVNGNAKTDHELIYSSGGVIDIYGGFFHNTDGNYTLNIEDKNRATGVINVYGGTYVNFDPSTGGQDPNNIKVMDGYKVVSETQANGDIWYTVVPE